eukprot:scaffold1590_cov417-Prasinococcus_capsulatus_cf.AAC.10
MMMPRGQARTRPLPHRIVQPCIVKRARHTSIATSRPGGSCCPAGPGLKSRVRRPAHYTLRSKVGSPEQLRAAPGARACQPDCLLGTARLAPARPARVERAKEAPRSRAYKMQLGPDTQRQWALGRPLLSVVTT